MRVAVNTSGPLLLDGALESTRFALDCCRNRDRYDLGRGSAAYLCGVRKGEGQGKGLIIIGLWTALQAEGILVELLDRLPSRDPLDAPLQKTNLSTFWPIDI